jgi:hypothetical protein
MAWPKDSRVKAAARRSHSWRAAGGVVGADGGENHHGEIEGVGDEEIGGGGADEFEIEDEEQREEETGCDRDAREPAGGEHENLGRSVQQGKGEMEK